MKNIFSGAAILCLAVSGTASYAQLSNVPRFQLGVSAGAFIYQGDLTPSDIGSYRTAKPALQLTAAKLFSRSLSLKGVFSFGALQGDDSRYAHPEYRRERNFYFQSPVAEVAVQGEWAPLGTNYRERGFSPYISAGIGYSFLHVKRDYSRMNVAYFGAESDLMPRLAEDAATLPPRGVVTIPVSVGARYYLNDRWGVSLETNYRITSSDYIDGFSRSANPSRNDHFYSHTVGVVYRIGKKNMYGCPTY